MWEIRNRTPFGAIGYFVRNNNGAEHWVVAVTGSFTVRPDGLLAQSEAQPPPFLAPRYANTASEMLADSDIAPFRPHVDIILSGIACLPGMEAARQFDARIKIGDVEKRARFFGDRKLHFRKGRPVIEGPSEIAGVKLTWRNALGGPDSLDPSAAAHTYNPIGMGWTSRWHDLPDDVEIDLPFIENPADLIVPGKPLPAPHGFGPLPPAWRPRLDHAGTYDELWRASYAPLPPPDFSNMFHQSAPADQVYRGPLEGVPVWVEGLHPDGPYGFRLPQMILEASTDIGGYITESRLRMIGVTLDARAKAVRLTWNADVPCNGRDHLVKGATVRLRQMAGVVR